jgi:DMSO/TMAO reductase YedYZ molybdopterin-dependent catalytic subunit
VVVDIRRLVLAIVWAALSAAGGLAAAQTSTAIAIAGNVAQPLSMTVADLKRLPPHQFDYVSPEAGHKGDGQARHYTGCLLRDVLAAAKPAEGKPRELRKSYALATATDGYEAVFSWAEVFVSPTGDSTYVVYARDGAPIGDDEGQMALITLADTKPVRHIKWLQKLTLKPA